MNLFPLIFVFPLVGFALLTFARERLSERVAAVIGVGCIGLSALLTAARRLRLPDASARRRRIYARRCGRGCRSARSRRRSRVKLDALSLTMLGVITGVGFFIHLFAAWYMRGDDGFARFFSYMNLFVASMLFLVLADDLLFLYFGWEGVGLCSYLLIGFWYKDPANGAAARKAFIVTRIGDTSMIIGLFVLYRAFGTLNIDAILTARAAGVGRGQSALQRSRVCCCSAAQWANPRSCRCRRGCADAMAGPTPVSALIHAATMVTAGVYLIARMHPLFDLSPFALECVGAVGAITLLLAGFTALMQTDIKKILAYSTMSQIGYMFLAEGVGAYDSRDVPPDDARVLQGAAVPRRGFGDPRDAPRAGHLQDGRPAHAAAVRVRDAC